jgi:hypothetical protein
MAQFKGPNLMKLNLIIIFTLWGLVNCQSQTHKAIDNVTSIKEKTRIPVEIHSRVDTTNTEIREIATLWVNYLSSEPDKISDNPYWNEEEKKIYRDFDLSRTLLYQLPSGNLLIYF